MQKQKIKTNKKTTKKIKKRLKYLQKINKITALYKQKKQVWITVQLQNHTHKPTENSK